VDEAFLSLHETIRAFGVVTFFSETLFVQFVCPVRLSSSFVQFVCPVRLSSSLENAKGIVSVLW